MTAHDAASILRRGEQQASIAIVFLVLSWIFIALRIWTRTYVISNFGWDDFAMILAGMIFTVYCAAMLYLEAHGGGTHITTVPDLIRLTKWVIISEAAYLITVMVLKISLGIFFARIVIQRWQLLTIHCTVGINVVSSIASLFYVIFRCGSNPDNYVYQQLEWKCAPRVLDRFFAYQSAAVTTLTDCIFAILPIFILWNASMDRRSKISVGLILSLAALGCICSMIRFQYVDGLTQIEDFFWNAVNIGIWSTIEPGAGIIAGCLATLRPFLKRFFLTAMTIRYSASRNTKEISQSLRPGKNHSQKGAGQSDIHGSRAGIGQVVKLISETSKTNESESDILLHKENSDLNSWKTNCSLELDRRTSHPNQMRKNIPITRDRLLVEACERPLPPLPKLAPSNGNGKG
ncbi:hypothetical protein B0J11DRAFT_578987 [Dendryphion nanum]|uniref:Rhodopsin domain-containing protein n=1 Tax=Dendryphion nanum TaxID=256645 RepID=A0A9P9E2M6_9PLEO|nr:hypothetical protein B0J11DRAFT_578987 [Dendryphion nanum]